VCQDEIQPEHFAILAGTPWTGGQEADSQRLGERTLKEIRDTAVRAVEHQTIVHALLEMKGNRTRAAKLLGVDYKTLYLKTRRYGIRTKEFLP
jgi:DNA-binding NtrC family response regulator